MERETLCASDPIGLHWPRKTRSNWEQRSTCAAAARCTAVPPIGADAGPSLDAVTLRRRSSAAGGGCGSNAPELPDRRTVADTIDSATGASGVAAVVAVAAVVLAAGAAPAQLPRRCAHAAAASLARLRRPCRKAVPPWLHRPLKLPPLLAVVALPSQLALVLARATPQRAHPPLPLESWQATAQTQIAMRVALPAAS